MRKKAPVNSNDADNCKTAVLHWTTQIENHGAHALIERETGTLVACSQNLDTITGFPVPQMLGMPFHELLPAAVVEGTASALAAGRRHLWHTSLHGKSLLVSAHNGHSHSLLEFESATESNDFDINMRFDFLEQIASHDEVQGVGEHLLEHVAGITGFDRVMLYRFLPNWDGKVIAERLKPGVDGYPNQHFPAGDIPENARHLYMVNHQRFIADTRSTPVPILLAGQQQTPDLTHSQLRAVPSVHIRYLENMQVRSSFSISILASGRLWGMVACHNRQPARLGFSERFLCEELARIASLQISALQVLANERERSRLQLQLGQIENNVASSSTPYDTFTHWLDAMLRIMGAYSMLLLRNEISEEIVWAGNKAAAADDFSPRASFDA